MPIIIKDYKWKQTINSIILQINLKGICERNVDILTSKRYIKIKYKQYFFDVILLHSINVEKSHCKITDTEIIFELKKNEDLIWDSLEPTVSKEEKLKLKQQLLDEEYTHIQEKEKDNVNKKAELKRIAVRKQIELDTDQRVEIDCIKNQEKANALGDINHWSSTTVIPDSDKTLTDNLIKTYNKQTVVKHLLPVMKLSHEIVPMPRSVRTLEIDFTPREFPTPSRESKLDEENEWLSKQAEARRSAGFISEDIRPEEKNPQFLKAKGDEFLKIKNYLGAISAYTFGITISPKFVDLYIARSEAHLLTENFNKTIQDCSTALDLLKPEVSLNLKERALCIGRRGEALCKFGLTKQGIEEIKISLKLMPSDYFTNVLKTVKNNYD